MGTGVIEGELTASELTDSAPLGEPPEVEPPEVEPPEVELTDVEHAFAVYRTGLDHLVKSVGDAGLTQLSGGLRWWR